MRRDGIFDVWESIEMPRENRGRNGVKIDVSVSPDIRRGMATNGESESTESVRNSSACKNFRSGVLYPDGPVLDPEVLFSPTLF